MNEEKLIDSIDEIDEYLISEAEAVRSRKRSFPFKAVSVIAACLFICIVSFSVLPYIFNSSPHESNTPTASPGAAKKNESIVEEDAEINDGETTSSNISVTPENVISTTVDNTVSTLPVFVCINSIENKTLICTVLDTMGSDNFAKGETVNIEISESTVLPDIELLPGDSCYVEYKISKSEGKTFIIALNIYFEVSDTTPALF